jgi:hypothetical protein
MDETTLVIDFPGASAADANRNAAELRSALLRAAPDLSVEQRRADSSAMDFGATLVLVLGTPAVVVAAKALRDWLKLRYSASISLKTADGTVIAKGLTGGQALDLAALLQNQSRSTPPES